MANLVDQINEMIDILEIINPQAAAAFRGGSAKDASNMVQTATPPEPLVQQPELPVQAVQPGNGLVHRISIARPDVQAPAAKLTDLKLNQLKSSLNADKLIEGIILSEILRPPVSRRRGFGRR